MDKPSEVVRKAKAASHLNQEKFSKLLNKSQSQISKYLSGKSTPSADTIMHCMNIIEVHDIENQADNTHKTLVKKVQKLEGSHNKHICEALISILDAMNIK